MRRFTAIVPVVLVAVGCRTVQMTGGTSGAGSPKGAVEQMLAAANSQDLQAISAVWGDETGLVRDRTDRTEVESRTFIMACVLKSSSQKVGDPQPDGTGRMILTADLTQGANSATTRFLTAKAKDGRWLVSNVDLPALQNRGFCSRPGS